MRPGIPTPNSLTKKGEILTKNMGKLPEMAEHVKIGSYTPIYVGYLVGNVVGIHQSWVGKLKKRVLDAANLQLKWVIFPLTNLVVVVIFC